MVVWIGVDEREPAAREVGQRDAERDRTAVAVVQRNGDENGIGHGALLVGEKGDADILLRRGSLFLRARPPSCSGS